MPMRLTVLVPTLNEAENLPELVARVRAAAPDAEMIVVDDASGDGTADLADRLAPGFCRAIRRNGSPGLAAAVAEGRAEARGTFVAVMDADLSHPPELLPRLVEAADAGGIAVASRYVPGGRIEGWPLHRRVASRLANLLARAVTPVRDATSGYFVFRRDRLDPASLDPRGFKIGLEVLAKGRWDSVPEVPYVFRDRARGRSKMSAGRAWDYLAQLATLLPDRACVAICVAIALASFALHLAYLPMTELTPHEAYYWQYSRHLDWSFYDHPPMSALWIGAGTALFGRNEFGVRFGGAVAGLGVTLFVFFAARRLAGARKALAVASALSCVPLFALLSASAGPDIPLAFFWSAAAWAVIEAVFARRPALWLVAGLALGGALLSKYTAVGLAGGVFIFLVSTPEGRRHLGTPWPWAALLVAAAAFTPVVWWNSQHQWASFAFQLSRRAGKSAKLEPGEALDYLAEQALVVTPMFLVAFLAALGRARPREPRAWFGACLFAPVWLGFLAVSMTTSVKRHWPGVGYLGGALLLATVPLPAWVRRRAWIAPAACALALALSLGVAVHAAVVPPIKPQATLAGWREGTERAVALRRPGEFIAAIGRKYRIASEVAFYSGGEGDVWADNILGRDALAYDDWGDVRTLAGRDALLVYDDPRKLTWDLEAGTLASHFESTEELERYSVTRHGVTIRTYVFLRGRGFRP